MIMPKKEYTNQELAKIYLSNERKLQKLEKEVRALKKLAYSIIKKRGLKIKRQDFNFKG